MHGLSEKEGGGGGAGMRRTVPNSAHQPNAQIRV